MAETYEDWGDYSEELIYQEKSKLGKLFSGRTLKKILKSLGLLLVLFVYGILFFRLCTGNAPRTLSGILWTEELYGAHETGEPMAAYSHKPVQSVADDGYFGVFDVLYFPEQKVLQFTVRYNNSTVKKLRQDRTEAAEKALRAEIEARLSAEHPDGYSADLDAAVEAEYAATVAEQPITVEIDDRPFVFLLRDDAGNVYTEYASISDAKNVYQFVRLSFSGVELLGTSLALPEKSYPMPNVPVASYLYKGPNAARSDAIRYLYLDMYAEDDVDFEGESFAYPIEIYRASNELKPSSIKAPRGVTKGIETVVLTDGK